MPVWQELENTVNEAPDRTLDGLLAGFWRSVIQHHEDDTWSVALYKNNTGKPDITHTAGSLDDLILLAYRSDGVDISHTREPQGPNNRVLMASLGLTRDGIKRRLRESGLEPTTDCLAEAVHYIRCIARDAAHDALVDFIETRSGNRANESASIGEK
jgi:hypothetical protein